MVKHVTRDVKNICICGYARIKLVTSRKWIPASNGYMYFLYSHVNGAGMDIVVFVPVDTHTRYTLI